MAQRMEIEVTSQLDESRWTWRAVGAKLPKGVLDSSILPAGTKAGDVLRAEYERGIDGIDILATSATKEREQPDVAARIELAPKALKGPEISVTYAPKGGGGRGPKRDRGDGPRGDKGGPRGDRPARGDRPGGDRPARGDSPRGEGRPSGPRSDAPRGERGAPRGPRRDGRPAELPVSTVHRNALLAMLGPEQLPIAEQLIRGGLPAVRTAIAEQEAAAKASGGAPVAKDAILAIADQLLPQTRLASWKDRAQPVAAAGAEARLRDLRTAVTAARTVTMDDDARATLKALRSVLDEKVKAMEGKWIERITTALDGGKIADALAVVASPPDQGTRCPAELAVRLADEAGKAMTAETAADDWLLLLGAVAASPVRRNVTPAGIPDDGALRSAAMNAAGMVPSLAKLLGLRIPPPPPRKASVRQAVVPE